MYSCQMQISIDEHKLSLISTDGYPVRPLEVDSYYMDGGDRYDFVIKADKEIGNYWLKVEVCVSEYLLDFTDGAWSGRGRVSVGLEGL